MKNGSKLNSPIRKLTFSAMFLAIALVLPFLTGQIPEIGRLLSPMHIPAFLCGLICGPLWGAVVGFTSPLLRMMLFKMPPIMTALPMAFELAAYAIAAGLLYKVFAQILCKDEKQSKKFSGRKFAAIYAAMIISMLAGRIIHVAVKSVMLGIAGTEFSLWLLFIEMFTGTWAGIIVQLVIIPPLTAAFERFIGSPLASTNRK